MKSGLPPLPPPLSLFKGENGEWIHDVTPAIAPLASAATSAVDELAEQAGGGGASAVSR